MRYFLPTALFAVTHYAAFLGLAAASYVLGRMLTRKCQYHSIWERLAVCTSLGLGATSYLIFCLCLVHALYPGTVLGALTLVVILGVSELRSLGAELTTSLRTFWNRGQLFAIAMGSLAIVLPCAFLPLYPPTFADATYYHLALAKLYVQHHGFVFAPYVHFSLFPQLTEMLFTLMVALYDDIAAQLVSFLMMIVTVVALFAFGRRLFSRRIAYWAAGVLLANPIFVWLGSVAYIEMGLTLFATMAIYACWNWMRDRTPQWLILAAFFAGFASGSKYSGLFFLGLIGAVVLWYGVRDREYAPTGMFVLLAAATATPWYWRSFQYTGNPVFPFFAQVFGYGFWTKEDVAYVLHDLHRFGVGRSVGAFISLPWQLAFNQNAFNAEAGINKRVALLLPLLLAFIRKDSRIRVLSAAILVYILVWFFGSQETRYLVPVLPLVSLSIAAAMDVVVEWTPLLQRWTRHAVVVGIIFALWAFTGSRFAMKEMRELGPVPVTQAQRDQLLSRYWPSYPAYKVLNALRGRNYTLYALNDPFMAYFCDGVYIGDFFGPGRYSRIDSRLADNQSLYRELKSLRVNYLLLVRREDQLHRDGFFVKHFMVIYARPPIVLFEINGTHD
jgi:4-amino-4-deoxy-L-arabinose transferase-like glycosyltransferase